MKVSLETQRQKVLRELGRVNRQIAATEKHLLRLAARLEVLAHTRAKAA
jgi:hypothetical protein